MDKRIINLEAQKKWLEIPEDIRAMLLSNVFCANCKLTTIVDYSISVDKFGIILNGKCKKCGSDVARVVED